ncbi:unnamed protein product [Calicophoron daubneyi]|uniref:MI domain-containing protein n=1 Tax=Calicophoron daubneyi TaxID=300641 RepID=A0AAV2TLE4_CALDB
MSDKVPPKKADNENAASEEESAGEMIWPQPDFERHLKTAAAWKDAQFLRKKRMHSASFSHSGVNGLTIDGVPYDVRKLSAALRRTTVGSTRAPFAKNSRKSRDGRRIPSKRGGKNLEDPTDVLDEIVLDHDDPDYDSDSNDPVTFETLSPSPSDENFEKIFTSLMKEFFIHGKTQEVVDALNDLNLAPHQRRRIPYLAVTMALQHKQTQYELTSELLSDLCGKVISQAHVQQGFLLILGELGELTIDFPKAVEHIGRFIARAMADDILPPKFIELQKSILSQQTPVETREDSKLSSSATGSPPDSAPIIGPKSATDFEAALSSRPSTRPGTRNLSDSSATAVTITEPSPTTTTSSGIGSASSLPGAGMTNPEAVMSALVRAESLLTLSHAFARLDNIWGVPVGPKCTKSLIKKIRGLLQAYLDSKDVDEAIEALVELDSPHFYHELVFQAIVMAIEKSTDETRELIVKLLNELCKSVIITPNQLNLGIRRVYAELPDLQLDVPAAYTLMERFMTEACGAGFATKKLASEMPAKPRKRFISETDSIYRTGHAVYPL